MNFDRLRRERPGLFFSSDERELVSAFDEPPEEVREAFLNVLPKLLKIYRKKREAFRKKDERLWREVVEEEAELVGSGM